MVASNDYTIYGIHNSVARYFWAAYQLFVFLSSFIGDSLILYASFQNNAFRINNLIVTIMQHIAVSDLVYATLSVLPSAISLLTNSWILGDVICYARVYLMYSVYPTGMYLMAMLTSCKFLHLRYPLRLTSWTKKRAHQVCCFMWLPPLITPILILALGKDDVHFDFTIYLCDATFKAAAWKTLRPIVSIFLILVPNFIIVATTISTLKYLATARKSARRVQGSVPWQGTLTVALTAVVYCISTLPLLFYHFGIGFVKDDQREGALSHVHRLVRSACLVNIMSNFYIYTLTIKSFRRFLFSKIFSNLPVCLQTSGNTVSSITGENIVR